MFNTPKQKEFNRTMTKRGHAHETTAGRTIESMASTSKKCNIKQNRNFQQAVKPAQNEERKSSSILSEGHALQTLPDPSLTLSQVNAIIYSLLQQKELVKYLLQDENKKKGGLSQASDRIIKVLQKHMVHTQDSSLEGMIIDKERLREIFLLLNNVAVENLFCQDRYRSKIILKGAEMISQVYKQDLNQDLPNFYNNLNMLKIANDGKRHQDYQEQAILAAKSLEVTRGSRRVPLPTKDETTAILLNNKAVIELKVGNILEARKLSTESIRTIQQKVFAQIGPGSTYQLNPMFQRQLQVLLVAYFNLAQSLEGTIESQDIYLKGLQLGIQFLEGGRLSPLFKRFHQKYSRIYYQLMKQKQINVDKTDYLRTLPLPEPGVLPFEILKQKFDSLANHYQPQNLYPTIETGRVNFIGPDQMKFATNEKPKENGPDLQSLFENTMPKQRQMSTTIITANPQPTDLFEQTRDPQIRISDAQIMRTDQEQQIWINTSILEPLDKLQSNQTPRRSFFSQIRPLELENVTSTQGNPKQEFEDSITPKASESVNASFAIAPYKVQETYASMNSIMLKPSMHDQTPKTGDNPAPSRLSLLNIPKKTKSKKQSPLTHAAPKPELNPQNIKKTLEIAPDQQIKEDKPKEEEGPKINMKMVNSPSQKSESSSEESLLIQEEEKEAIKVPMLGLKQTGKSKRIKVNNEVVSASSRRSKASTPINKIFVALRTPTMPMQGNRAASFVKTQNTFSDSFSEAVQFSKASMPKTQTIPQPAVSQKQEIPSILVSQNSNSMSSPTKNFNLQRKESSSSFTHTKGKDTSLIVHPETSSRVLSKKLEENQFQDVWITPESRMFQRKNYIKNRTQSHISLFQSASVGISTQHQQARPHPKNNISQEPLFQDGFKPRQKIKKYQSQQSLANMINKQNQTGLLVPISEEEKSRFNSKPRYLGLEIMSSNNDGLSDSMVSPVRDFRSRKLGGAPPRRHMFLDDFLSAEQTAADIEAGKKEEGTKLSQLFIAEARHQLDLKKSVQTQMQVRAMNYFKEYESLFSTSSLFQLPAALITQIIKSKQGLLFQQEVTFKQSSKPLKVTIQANYSKKDVLSSTQIDFKSQTDIETLQKTVNLKIQAIQDKEEPSMTIEMNLLELQTLLHLLKDVCLIDSGICSFNQYSCSPLGNIASFHDLCSQVLIHFLTKTKGPCLDFDERPRGILTSPFSLQFLSKEIGLQNAQIYRLNERCLKLVIMPMQEIMISALRSRAGILNQDIPILENSQLDKICTLPVIIEFADPQTMDKLLRKIRQDPEQQFRKFFQKYIDELSSVILEEFEYFFNQTKKKEEKTTRAQQTCLNLINLVTNKLVLYARIKVESFLEEQNGKLTSQMTITLRNMDLPLKNDVKLIFLYANDSTAGELKRIVEPHVKPVMQLFNTFGLEYYYDIYSLQSHYKLERICSLYELTLELVQGEDQSERDSDLSGSEGSLGSSEEPSDSNSEESGKPKKQKVAEVKQNFISSIFFLRKMITPPGSANIFIVTLEVLVFSKNKILGLKITGFDPVSKNHSGIFLQMGKSIWNLALIKQTQFFTFLREAGFAHLLKSGLDLHYDVNTHKTTISLSQDCFSLNQLVKRKSELGHLEQYLDPQVFADYCNN